MTKREMRKLERCIKSALDNFSTRMTPININALMDIECDLEVALAAVRSLIMNREHWQ
jgi:hypothetical protein